MPLDPAKKTAIGEVVDALLRMQAPRGKRLLCGMFMDLVDRVDWPQYYEVNVFCCFFFFWKRTSSVISLSLHPLLFFVLCVFLCFACLR